MNKKFDVEKLVKYKYGGNGSFHPSIIDIKRSFKTLDDSKKDSMNIEYMTGVLLGICNRTFSIIANNVIKEDGERDYYLVNYHEEYYTLMNFMEDKFTFKIDKNLVFYKSVKDKLNTYGLFRSRIYIYDTKEHITQDIIDGLLKYI